ncbi:transcription termination factor 1-like isoform X2 [Patiria miniata]|uniref:Myb-like domain-containing protein n=1 Tax=Patiria miniata TaxID=46514 RepID=A0A913Z369_PATMI|nr:transcription termination factor 1-like isoform X2 [Patiria miniata]
MSMTSNPDVDSHMRRKKKKKKRESKSDYAWIKTEHETQLSGAQSENVDFWKVEDNQTQDAPKKRKKKKKRNVKTEDLVDGASSVDLNMVCDSDNFDSGYHPDGCTPKKKKKKKRKHSVLGDAQSKEINKREMASQEELQNLEEGRPFSFQIERQPHKCKKKRKQKELEQLLSRTLVVDEHETDSILSASDSAKQTSDDAGHKKRKQKVKGDHSPQTLWKKTADIEAKCQKRKRKAQENLNKLKGDKYNESNHGDSVTESVGHSVPQKKRKKKNIVMDTLQTSGYSESQIPSNNLDVQKITPENAPKSKKRRKKKKKSTCSKDGNDDAMSTQSSEMNNCLVKSRRKQVKSDCSATALSKISLSSSEEIDPPSEGEPYEAAHSKTNASLEKQQFFPSASRSVSSPWCFGGKACPSETEEDNAWIKDLPFYFKDPSKIDLTVTSVTPKEGVVLNKGKWTGLEDRILQANVDSFCKQYNIKDIKEVILPLLFEERTQIRRFLRQHNYILRLCRGLKRLPLDVYVRSRKICDDRNYKGKYTEEEISAIMKLRKVYGHRWTQIARRVDRSGQSVQDWYRSRPMQGHRSDKWSKSEQRQLRSAIMAATKTDEEDLLHQLVGIPWREVVPKVPTRSRSQCMNQWKHNLCWSVGDRTKRDWTPEDSVDLIESVYALDVNEEFEIDWVKMHKKFWERAPSPAKLSLQWYTLKLKHLKNWHFMTFEEILDELYHKILPILKERIQQRIQRRIQRQEARQSRFKSKEFISDTEEDSCSDNEWY